MLSSSLVANMLRVARVSGSCRRPQARPRNTVELLLAYRRQAVHGRHPAVHHDRRPVDKA